MSVHLSVSLCPFPRRWTLPGLAWGGSGAPGTLHAPRQPPRNWFMVKPWFSHRIRENTVDTDMKYNWTNEMKRIKEIHMHTRWSLITIFRCSKGLGQLKPCFSHKIGDKTGWQNQICSWLNQGNTVWRFREIRWDYLLQVCSWFIVKTWRSHTVSFLNNRPEFPVKMQNFFVAHTNQDLSSNKQRIVLLGRH